MRRSLGHLIRPHRRAIAPTPIQTLERRLLFAVTPAAVHQLATPDATVEASLGDPGLLNAWSPLGSLKAPNASAKSYLNLKAYVPFDVNFGALRRTMAGAPSRTEFADGESAALTIALPKPDGSYARFRVVRSDTLGEAVAKKYGGIQTFVGQGIDDPTATLAMDYTPLGFHASVRGTAGNYNIDPYFHRNPAAGAVAYWISDQNTPASGFDCETDFPAPNEADGELALNAEVEPLAVAGTSLLGATLRSYDLVISTTPSYTTFAGGVAAAAGAVATTVSRLNQVYETDFAIHMTLVKTYNFTSANSPFTSPSNASNCNTQNQTYINANWGAANYDFSHVYHQGSDNGLAGGIGSVGSPTGNRSGYTSTGTPVGDNFVIDYVAHEMGHQFGGRHTFNNIDGSQGDSSTFADEVGSGQSIMGYAGLGSDQENVLIHSVAQFNANNYVTAAANAPTQILEYTTDPTKNGYISATKTPTGNTPPSVSTDAVSYSIPVSTPFSLTAIATDPDAGDSLTYSWEQVDGGSPVSIGAVGGINGVPSATVTSGPVFRVFAATPNPSRTFPVMPAVLANRTYDAGERLPSVARTMRFAGMVYDNHAGGGGVAVARVSVTTVSGAAFSLSTFNAATTVAGGSSQTISWTNTNTAAGSTINAGSVNILLSTDGGNTFPITLAAATPNDGSQSVQLPFNLGTSAARIKIVPTNNVFFDVNNANFTITNTPNVSQTPATPDLAAASDTGALSADNLTNLDNSTPAKDLSFSVGNTIIGATVTIYSDGVAIGSATATGTSTTVETSGALDLTDGSHAITARQTESGAAQSAVSPALTIFVDTVGPAATITPVPEPRTTGVSSIALSFGEAVSGFDLADLALSRDGGANLLTAGNAPTTGDSVAFALPNLLAPTSTSGSYTLTIIAAGSGITDAAGNAMAANASETWVHGLPAWLSAAASVVAWNSQTKTLAVSGSATITADPAADTPAVIIKGESALLTINPASDAVIHVASLALTEGGHATLSPHGAGTLRALVLDGGNPTIDATSALDLADNAMVIKGGSVAATQALLAAGYNGGSWFGPAGIVSSSAAGNNTAALGVADNATLARTTFAGVTGLAAADVLVRYTYTGDADLSGHVTLDDFSLFLLGYQNAGTTWLKGDFDYSGSVTLSDFSLFVTGYQQQGPPL